jgi:transcriptional regulator with XRE-family HTH domain
MKIGNKIKKLRNKIGLNQEQVAYFLSKNIIWVGDIENDIIVPSVNDIEKLSDLFGLELDDIFKDDYKNDDIPMSFLSKNVENDDLKQIAEFQKIIKR